jgi:hypothetical protein
MPLTLSYPAGTLKANAYRMIFSGVGWLKGRETLPLQFQLFV